MAYLPIIYFASAFHSPSFEEATVENGKAPLIVRKEKEGKRKLRRRKDHSYLAWPVAQYEPGVGGIFGLAASYAYRPASSSLNKAFLFARGTLSTFGTQEHQFIARTIDLFGSREVFDLTLRFSKDSRFPYYGSTTHSRSRIHHDDRHLLLNQLQSFKIDFNYGHPVWVWKAPKGGRKTLGTLRAIVGWRGELNSVDGDEDSILANERPDMLGKTRLASYYAGFSWDSRNSDWHPSEGSFHDVTIASAGPWSGATSRWTRLHASFRFYRSLGTPRVVLATQFRFDSILGETPALLEGNFGGLFEAEGIGGKQVGRGYSRRRFAGPNKAFASAEYRYTPFEFRIRKMEFSPGIKAFLDLGFLPESSSAFGQIRPLPSVGLGGFLVISQFLVMRCDAAFSPEGRAIYFSANHAF